MLPKQNRTYPAHYKKFISQFNVDGIEMPMTVADVPLFEEQNSKLLLYNFFKNNFQGLDLIPAGLHIMTTCLVEHPLFFAS